MPASPPAICASCATCWGGEHTAYLLLLREKETNASHGAKVSETDQNPFPNDPDRAAIWQMLVPRDIDAFVNQDWGMVDGDFVREAFLGINGNAKDNPDGWTVGFPSLEAYRAEWLRQAAESAAIKYAEDQRAGIFRATTLREIEIAGDVAVARRSTEFPQ